MALVGAITLAVLAEGTSNEQWIPRDYFGVALDVSKAKNGDRVPLGIIIFTPLPSREGYVQLEFPRSAVSKEFLDEFFLHRSNRLRSLHPFWQRGVESILTKKSLIVRLHFGVVLHLRNDIPNYPDYRTFAVENPQAKLVTFGHETYLGKPKTSEVEELREFFIALRPKECLPDGPELPGRPTSYTCPPGEHFPKMYEPRVE